MGVIRDIFRQSVNPVADLTLLGYVYNISDASAIAAGITGTTTMANTTPTFSLHVAATSSYAVIPLYLSLGQTGTVAGGAISVVMEVDNAVRYSSGGTDAGVVQNAFVNPPATNVATPGSALPTGITFKTLATLTNAAGARIWAVTVGQDVSPAEGVPNELVWTPPSGAPEVLCGNGTVGASWNIYTNAGTTGPTWWWEVKVAIFPATEL